MRIHRVGFDGKGDMHTRIQEEYLFVAQPCHAMPCHASSVTDTDTDMNAAAEDYSSSSASSASSLSPPTSPGSRRRILLQKQQQHHHHQQLPPKRRAGRSKFRETRHPVYRGVRARAGGTRWVCEVREPQAQARIWLGTYPTPEMAARAHDVAAIALRRARAADLNFPDSAHTLPRARTAAPEDIRRAAAQAAELYRPSSAAGQQHMHLKTTAAAAATAPPPLPLMTTSSFLDEDAIFDMPGLIDDMARGMMLTPPAMGRGLDWGALDDEDHTHVDCTLWVD